MKRGGLLLLLYILYGCSFHKSSHESHLHENVFYEYQVNAFVDTLKIKENGIIPLHVAVS
jgi:hypothetical protein